MRSLCALRNAVFICMWETCLPSKSADKRQTDPIVGVFGVFEVDLWNSFADRAKG